MKIGIFGDSFADDHNLWPNPYNGVGPSWIDYLRSKGHQVDNYAGGGSSLFYAYEKFLTTYQNYDKIVFAITNYNRYYVYVDEVNANWFNIGQVEQILNSCTDKNKRNILESIRLYYAYIQDEEFQKFCHQLLIKDIKKTHDNCLLIPCFEDSLIDRLMPLINISRHEANYWGLEEILPREEDVYDARKCHMCEENNLVLGKSVEKWINTGIYELDERDFCNPTKNFEHYFRTDFKILKEQNK